MTAPIVVVTRGLDGYASKALWFEDEAAFYDGNPTLVMEFNRASCAWSYVSLRISSPALRLRAAHVIERLERTPWTDMAFAATHTVAEPGAPLEPIPGRAA